MLHKYLILLFALSCGGDHLTRSENPQCNVPCYEGPAQTQNIGNCKDGVMQCDLHGNTLGCVGQVFPQAEDCSGQDLDCDGVPNDVPAAHCYTGPVGTENVGACHGGLAGCVNGVLACSLEVVPATEQCGKDLNCNGIVGDIPPNPCYDGPLGTVILPNCHYGYQGCVGSVLVCLNEKIPNTKVNYDVVFVLTTDGSMQQWYPNIHSAIIQWCQANTGSNCALIETPDTFWDFGGNPINSPLIVLNNLNMPSNILNALNSVVFQPINGWPGDVGIYDAIYDVCDLQKIDPLNTLALNWTPGHIPAILYFTDEEGQETYHMAGLDQSQVAAECTGNNVINAGFLNLGRDAQINEYSGISGPNIFLIDTNPQYISDFGQVIPSSICQ